MKHVLFVLALGVSLVANASDPIGIYGKVSKVVFEPNAETPTAVKIYGAFALAKQGPGGVGQPGPVYLPGGTYLKPQKGFLYYKLVTGSENEIRIEWSDLASVAGTGQCIGFGARYTALDRVRTGCGRGCSAFPYPIERSMGVMKVSHQNSICEELP